MRVVKKIQLEPEVPAQIRAIPQAVAMTILHSIRRYAGHRRRPRETAVRRVQRPPAAARR